MTAPGQRISDMDLLADIPAVNAFVPVIQTDVDPDKNYRFDLGALLEAIETGTLSPLLQAISNAGSAADKFAYYAGPNAVSLADLTAAARTFLAASSATAERAVLGLGTAALLASDTDASLAANSDSKIATQKAVKAYVDALPGGADGIINVKDYGAVGDGVTDDYAAITAAIAAGTMVFFPPATYAIGTGLTVGTVGQVLLGYGATLKKTANFEGITVTAVRAKIVGLTINGNGHSASGAGVLVESSRAVVRDVVSIGNLDGIAVYGPGTIPGADLNIIDGCETYGNAHSGIYLHNATDAFVANCIVQTNAAHGIILENQSYSATIVNCHIDDNNTGNVSGNNITAKQADSLCVTNCVLTNCENGGDGIEIDSTPADQSGFRVTSCAIAQNGGYGVKIVAAGGHTSNRVVLTGNRFTGNTSGTVQIQTGCSNNVIVGNDLSGVAISDSGTSTVNRANDVASSSDITEAAASDIWAGSATTKYLSPGKLFAAAAGVALTSSTTITPDGNNGFNFTLTLAHNTTLANPSNFKEGQSGLIKITQDGTGSRTMAYGTNWKFPSGAPVLSTAAGAIDLLAYSVWSGGIITATLSKAYSS